MSLERDNPASTHRREGNSDSRTTETQTDRAESAYKTHDPTKESSIVLTESNSDNITEGPEVISEPPQVDPNSA